ncbi:MAG TPA: hypothetical protein VFM94_08110 [Solirubrobacterales bacterium]|nr:hypothetical protein [Solirubrobacterales bacterium]
MLNERGRQITIGSLLLTIGLLGLLSHGSMEFVRHTHPDVEGDVSNVAGTVQISVECEQAAAVTSGEALPLDLGYMSPDTQIFVSVLSSDQHPAWDIELRSNGDTFFEDRQGNAKTPLAPRTDANAIVFARAFTAGGEEVGSIGCQGLDVVSRREVPDYVPASAEKEAPRSSADESPFRPRHSPYEQIDALGRWSPLVLAVLGVIAAATASPVRRLAWSHKGTLATGALAIVSAGLFQVAALPTFLMLTGCALLFAVAAFLILGEPRTRRLLPWLD